MQVEAASEGSPLDARAFRVGRQLDVRAFERTRAPLQSSPMLWGDGERGHFALFRFGIAVCFGMDPEAERALLAALLPFVRDTVEPRLAEEVDVIVVQEGAERVLPDGLVRLRASDTGRLAVVADVLAKSALLSHHEVSVSSAFDHVEALADHLQRGTWLRGDKLMMREIGAALSVQVATVGRAEVGEKPDFLWDEPQLHRLHERLAHEFELGERDRALQRKLELVADGARTYVELQHTRKGLHLEWAIVLLIVFEIGMVFWEKLVGAGGGHG